MVPTINSTSENLTEYCFAIWYPETEDAPGEWFCDHSGRVFLFTSAGATVVKNQLDVDPYRPLEIRRYTDNGRTIIYNGHLLNWE